MIHCKRLLFTFFFIVFSSSFAWGVMYRSLTLKQMVAISPRILLFTVTDQRIEYDEYESKFYVNYVTGRLEEGIKGVEDLSPGEMITFKQVTDVNNDEGWDGTKAAPRLNLPKYKNGQTYLLFLAGDSNWGMASPIGGPQGVLPAEQVNGEWILPTLGAHPLLFQSLQKQVGLKALTKSQLGLGKGDSPKGNNRFSDFKSLIEVLMEE